MTFITVNHMYSQCCRTGQEDWLYCTTAWRQCRAYKWNSSIG